MADLVKVDTGLITERVRAVLPGFPQVAGAYLFGSVLGECRPDSDIDLGIILEAGIDPGGTESDRLEAEIAMQLPPEWGHPYDLTILNPDKPLFAFKAISQGKLIYIRNRNRVDEVIEYVSRRYADLYPRYRQALEEIFTEVMSGGIDRDRILAKTAFIREQTENIRELLTVRSRDEILADPWLIRGLKYSLQTSVEAMIDLAYHIAARNFGHAPGDARDAVRILSEGGLIPPENVPVYAAMIGFRNRIVHGYQEVSAERVFQLARDEIGDFDRFLSDISTVLR